MAGKLGQFDVVVDGKVVARRGGGFCSVCGGIPGVEAGDRAVRRRGGNVFTKLLGGGWPEPADVIAKIEELQRAGPSA